MLPLRTKNAIDKYVNHGIPTGDFLCAVLANDLMMAFAKADVGNRHAMYDIVKYVYNDVPYAAHGSYEKVDNWIKKKREERQKKESAQ